MRGSIKHDLPTLTSAALTLTAIVDGDTYEVTEKISEHSVFSVRRDGRYGGPLVKGENVLVGDMGIGHWSEKQKVRIYVEAVARLGGTDGKVLWAVEAEVEVEI